MEFRETRELMRIVIGDDRYDLLYAYRCEGISVRELAKRTGRSVHAMEVSLSRWQKTCRKALKTSGKILIPILWIGVSFCPLMGVLGVRA